MTIVMPLLTVKIAQLKVMDLCLSRLSLWTPCHGTLQKSHGDSYDCSMYRAAITRQQPHGLAATAWDANKNSLKQAVSPGQKRAANPRR